MKLTKIIILTGLLSVFLFGEVLVADNNKTNKKEDATETLGIKLGYVDMSVAIRTTREGQSAEKQLEKEFQKKQKELEAKEGDLKTMVQNLKKQAMVISDEVRSQKEMVLQEEQLKFQKLLAESRLEMQTRERELTEPILEKLHTVIDRIAKREKYDMILQKADITILWSKPKFDLTDQVIKEFDDMKSSKKKN